MLVIKAKASHHLKHWGQHLKLDLHYLAREGFWTTLKFGIVTIGSILTTIAFGNLLPKETYGIYSYLLSLASTLAFLTISGSSTAIIRSVARGYEEVANYAFNFQLRYNTIAGLVVLSSAIYYGYKGNWLFAGAMTILALAVPLSTSYFSYEPILIGSKNFKKLTQISVLTTSVNTAVIIGTIFITQNPLFLILNTTLTSLITNYLVYKNVSSNIKTNLPTQEQIAEFRRTSFNLTGAGLLSSAANYLDKILLFQVAGPANLAIYGFAIAGPEKLRGLIKNWAGTILPKLAGKSIKQIKEVFYRRLLYSLVVGIILSAIYISVAPILFKLLLPKYLESIKYSQVYGISLAVAPILAYIGNVFSGLNLLRAIYISSVLSQVIRIISIVAMTLMFKTWGLILGVSMSSIVNTILNIIIWEIESRRLTE